MDRDAFQERFGIIGTSPALRHVIDRVRQVAKTDITVLVEGESGVGKELVAQALHALSPRRHKPLLTLNCGAIPEGLLESELFGAEKGAYTGSVERRTGYFEEADGGSLFLDEIGEMPLQAQVRLLRVLETGEFSRVGSTATRRADVRVIAATNKDLGREVQAGRFREDLYYRLSTVIIRMPPLRERREDIGPIFEHFLHRYGQQYNTPRRRLTDDARALLLRYAWPGNVRELRNVAEQVAVLLREETVRADDLQPFLRGVTAGGGAGLMPVARAQGDAVDETRERELIYRVLLELRMELREVKEQVGRLVAGAVVPREAAPGEVPHERSLVLVRDVEPADYDALIEDVAYEIENGHEAAPRSAPPEKEEEAPLPTLEEAERALIAQALARFDGNRRQTARALGISERTLYRKIKEQEEEDA